MVGWCGQCEALAVATEVPVVWEVCGEEAGVAVGVEVEDVSATGGRRGWVDAHGGGDVGAPQLQGVVDEVGGEQRGLAVVGDLDDDVSGGVAGRGDEPDPGVDAVVGGYQVQLSGVRDRRDAVGDVV